MNSILGGERICLSWCSAVCNHDPLDKTEIYNKKVGQHHEESIHFLFLGLTNIILLQKLHKWQRMTCRFQIPSEAGEAMKKKITSEVFIYIVYSCIHCDMITFYMPYSITQVLCLAGEDCFCAWLSKLRIFQFGRFKLKWRKFSGSLKSCADLGLWRPNEKFSIFPPKLTPTPWRTEVLRKFDHYRLYALPFLGSKCMHPN